VVAETVTIRGQSAFIVSLESGDVLPDAAPGVGLYAGDTRHLSLLALRLNDAPPVLMGTTALSPAYHSAQLANPALKMPDGRAVRPQTISVHRERVLYCALHERLEIVNYNIFPVVLTLNWFLSGDFLDIFDIRAYRPRPRGAILAPQVTRETVRLRYVGRDEHLYETLIELLPAADDARVVDAAERRSPLPVTVELPHSPIVHEEHALPGERVDDLPIVRATYELTLPSHRPVIVGMRVVPSFGKPAQPARRDFNGALRRWHAIDRRWARRHTEIVTDNDSFNALLACSHRDVRSLLAPLGGGGLLLAGLPWFAVPFGRDSIISALQTLILGPDIAYATLRFLARHQGTKEDEWRDEEPGKILHELRSGELARLRLIPHTPYYGTIDATPLFVVLFDELLQWTGDQRLLHDLLPAVERAVRWIIDYGDLDGDGYLEYRKRSERGLYNQAWKDSHDSYLLPDGRPSKQPTASAEVQGYAYDALLRVARLYRRLGREADARDLEARALRLRARFHHDFWLAHERFFAIALDGDKRPVPAVASNPGHCLWSGLIEPTYARPLARRLVADDMFSGWGVRTLSAASPNYNPMSYHNGSVWPHDNALIAAGLRRYGYDAEALRVIRGIVDAARHFPWQRLPELFCGFPREGESGRAPAPYPMACSPQAWAAGVPFLFVQTILGLRPDAAQRVVHLAPAFPDWLSWVELHNLQIGGARLDLRVSRDGVTLLRNPAGLAVALRERPMTVASAEAEPLRPTAGSVRHGR
jgi:glycogen debranching enzyme